MDLKGYKTAVQADIAACESCRDFLSVEHLGEYVLIYGGIVRGTFASRDEARNASPNAYPRAIIKIVPSSQPNVDWTATTRPLPVALREAA
jgi:hypothetical protein